MSDTSSQRSKEVAHCESNFQNMKNSDSIPSKARVPENSGEPIYHVLEQSNGETPQREVPSPSSNGKHFNQNSFNLIHF